MKILLVEDNEQLTELLKDTLTEQHYTVDTAADGQTGWELARSLTYDLILLDVVLPELDGISLCRQLRSQGNQVPVLLLTAKATSHDRVLGLDAGADDYVVKPVDLPELTARIRALLRRGTTTTSPVLECGNLRLEPDSCEVTYGDRPLPLSPKEFALLELFLRNRQRVYSRSAILEQLWSFDDELPGEDTVKAHIKGLRQKLKAVGAADLIETVYGLGYRLNSSLLEISEAIVDPKQQAIAEKNQKRQQGRERIAKIWQQSQGKILERVKVLEQAVEAVAQNSLNQEMRQQAYQEAHKLAGTLGTFGVEGGSELARQIERLLELESLTPEQQQALQQAVMALKQRVEGASLPLVPQEMPPINPTSTHSDSLPRLLIVDDDRELVDLLVMEATAQGLQVTIADNLDSARAAIQQVRPDVVLLDLSFADTREDGLSLLAELSHYSPPVPVLVFTGSHQLTDRVAVARFKGRGFLQKPTTPADVLQAVTQALAAKHVGTPMPRVLAVDDDPITLRIVTALLEAWGVQVTTMTTPAQFWQTLELTRPDLIVLDVEMPDVNGIELCQAIRNDLNWSWVPVLFLTGRSDSETIHQVFAAGADDYVTKPIVAPEFVTRIMNRLERTRMLQAQAETDSLTGLANRQQSTQDLQRFFQLAHAQQPVCVAWLELDRLKSVNHQFGHRVGDQMLRQMGQTLRRELRTENVVSRWGGGEFVVGLYGMTRSDGIRWLTEILTILQQRKVEVAQGEPLRITFSAGVVQYPQDGEDLHRLYQVAREVLDRAIAQGGNQVLAGRE